MASIFYVFTLWKIFGEGVHMLLRDEMDVEFMLIKRSTWCNYSGPAYTTVEVHKAQEHALGDAPFCMN